MTEATAPAHVHASWTPNQEAARREIIDAAADLVGEHGLSACTFRSVAARAGVTKSTVNYYFDDANELMDLSVGEVFERVARFARESVRSAPDASAALGFMVRLFMGREKLPTAFKFRESMLWPAYTAHAWKRGAKERILRGLETLRSVVQLALERAPMSTAGRGAARHVGAQLPDRCHGPEHGRAARPGRDRSRGDRTQRRRDRSRALLREQ